MGTSSLNSEEISFKSCQECHRNNSRNDTEYLQEEDMSCQVRKMHLIILDCIICEILRSEFISGLQFTSHVKQC